MSVQLVVYTGLLIWLLSYSAGLAVLVAFLPIITKITGKSQELRKESLEWTDKRIKLTQEILSGVKVLKYATLFFF